MSSNVIKYVHNDSIVEIKNADPNKTLLNYIRLDLKKFDLMREKAHQKTLLFIYSIIRFLIMK